MGENRRRLYQLTLQLRGEAEASSLNGAQFNEIASAFGLA